MKFIKTVNLWEKKVQHDIAQGKLKLQRGQWCVCGDNGKRCRFVYNDGYAINVVHWQGSAKATNELFKKRIELIKSRV